MSSPAPTRLGSYEVVSRLGKGGMGEVWRARDPRLNREVAIKVSAQQFTDRFEREAHAIAALNHPNICTLFDVGPNYLVMELIEGPTLAERIAQGPVPLEEALGIARQIADALEAAHEKGIVHRDLKPANIKIRPDGSVKVLDFGLAKSATEPEVTNDSPTMLSVSGMILGTAGYMSPEQARGQTVDKRSDIWAFGVVLYEMLTAQRLFDGGTISDSLAAILTKEPDLTLVPEKTRRLLAACLEKDPRKRLRDIGDWTRLLETQVGQTVSSVQQAKGLPYKIAAAIFALLAAAIAFAHFREKPPETPVTRFSITPPDKVHFSGTVPVVSPDGRQVVFEATGGKSQLWLRPLDSLTAQPLAGTENATFPFWSPDSQWIGFFAGGKLKKMSASGGPVTVLADAPNGRGGTWSPAGVILFAPGPASGLAVVSQVGGDARIVLPRGRKNQRFPRFLPDGRHFLYLLGNAGDYVIAVGSLDSPKDGQPLPGVVNSFAEYADGRLVYLQGDTLVARAFNAKKMAYTGDAVTLAEQVVASSGVTATARFSASGNGVLVYQRASNDFQLTWLDRAGKRLGTVGEAGDLAQPRFSPDRTNVAVGIREASGGASDIWLYDVPHGLRTRLTFQTTSALNQDPVWSPDGAVIFFRSDRGGESRIVRKRADGSGGEELLLSSTSPKWPLSFSPDGKYLAYSDSGDATDRDIWILPDPLGKPGMSKPFPFMRTEFNEDDPQFSPDGHWIAYLSNESGRNEVYVAPFPGPGGKRQISTAGGTAPRWRPDGKELFYLAADNRLMAAEVELKGNVVEVKKVEALFGPLTGIGYDVSADGQRFLAAIAPEGQVDEPLTVVQNWPAGLKK